MDRKFIGYALGIIIAVYLIYLLLPYIVIFLAACGAWHLFEEYQKNNKRKF
jgi:uncharacterized membrane protein YccC